MPPPPLNASDLPSDSTLLSDSERIQLELDILASELDAEPPSEPDAEPPLGAAPHEPPPAAPVPDPTSSSLPN